MTIFSYSSRKKLHLFLLLIALFSASAALAAFFLFFEGEHPTISLETTAKHLGKKGIVALKVSDAKSGLRDISVVAHQGQLSKELYAVSFPRAASTGQIGPALAQETITFDSKQQGLTDGPMTLRVTAHDYSLRGWLRGNSTVFEQEMIVDTVPPQLSILQSEQYITPGGAGIVIYRLGEEHCRSGVTVNGRFHPGFLVGDGRKDVYITYFALPYDAEGLDKTMVSAVDPAGNETVVPFSTTYKKNAKKTDTIAISDSFLATKIPEFRLHYPEMTGDLLAQYLYTNTTIRDQNNKRISELCRNPWPERLWQGTFARMPGSPKAGFADYRNYTYNGEVIDNQVHLGVDIASTKAADVRAANHGKVIFAEYLGIYGNMVMLDHGQGVFSLYSHLSNISTEVGTMVDKTTVLGTTGTSGMAGGDHLHFSMLINGVFAMPKEWWDPHWIEVTIEGPLALSKK
jgi:murein DD-endopeptidase MepM/ murein hydrolase activator NlpD